MTRRFAFTILEVLLALAVVALVMAVIAPAMVGALRAERQARAALEPMAQESSAFSVLRDDLIATPQPTGSLAQPFMLSATAINGLSGSELVFTTTSPPPFHPDLITSAPDVGQAVVTWSVRAADDGHGLSWTRSRNANLLATGTAPTPMAEVMLDHLASLTIEVLSNGSFVSAYNSSDAAATLPTAVRISYAYLRDADQAGPIRTLLIDLPLVALGKSSDS